MHVLRYPPSHKLPEHPCSFQVSYPLLSPTYPFPSSSSLFPSLPLPPHSPVVDPLSNATYGLNSNDNSTSTATPPIDTSYKRFEQSATKKTPALVLKPRKTGSNHLLQEITRWAILEPHEDETAEGEEVTEEGAEEADAHEGHDHE